MAMTLNEYSKIAKDNLLGFIADNFLMESNVMQQIVWQTNKQLSVGIPSMDTLPSVSWRKVNAAYSESTGTVKHKTESKYIFGHDIDVDVVIAKASDTIEGARQLQRRMSAKAMAFEFNDVFINGDPASDEFKGLSKRVDDINADGYTSQYIDGGSTASAGRGMLYDSTERQYFFDMVNKLIHSIAGHDPDGLLMNSKMLLAFESAARREGLLKKDADMFGRTINTYGASNIPLIDIGLKADQSTEIITNAEVLSGGADETSIYAVKYGENEFLWGLQQEPLSVRDLGEVQTKPVYRDRVEWVVGLAHSNPRSIGRLYGLVADGGA
jgi:hypothetical protein